VIKRTALGLFSVRMVPISLGTFILMIVCLWIADHGGLDVFIDMFADMFSGNAKPKEPRCGHCNKPVSYDVDRGCYCTGCYERPSECRCGR